MALVPLWAAVPLLLLWWLGNKIRLRLFYDLHRLPTASPELPILGHLFHIRLFPRAQFTQCIVRETLKLGKIWRVGHGLSGIVFGVWCFSGKCGASNGDALWMIQESNVGFLDGETQL